MNRNERRRARRKQAHIFDPPDGSLVSVEILTLNDIDHRPDLARPVMGWVHKIPADKPYCAGGCGLQWTAWNKPSPAVAFCIIAPLKNPDKGGLGGICVTCAQSPDRDERVTATIKQIYDARELTQPTEVKQ